MDIPMLWWSVIGLSSALVLATIAALQLLRRLRKEIFRRKSLSSKYGKLTEQFLPLVETFPWDPGKFRFLGTPIDGVQFEDDRVIFVEFKSSNSKLSTSQRHIRNLVNEGKVEFEVVRVS